VESDSFIVSELLHQLSDFFLAYEVRPGIYNKSPHCILLRYVTSLDSFLMDLIASLPFILEKIIDSNRKQFEDISENAIIENLYLLRFIRLYHYFKYQTSRKDDLNISIFRYKITLSVTSFCLMAHMLACIFYWISPCERPDLTNKTFRFLNLCPPPNTGLDRNGWTTKYIGYTESIVVTTISTTGFGDIVPVTITEMAVGIFCIFCGAFILSMILSQFTSGMGSLTRTKREYMYQVLLLLKYLRNIGLSTNRQFQVPYFQDTQERIFIRQLSSRVTHSFYIPGTFVQHEGDKGTSLFVVYKGLVSGTLKLKNVKKGDIDVELKSIFNPGDAFGRSAALFHYGIYKQSYRAETMVEILEVKQKDILHLAQKFPRIKKRILSYINSKYSERPDIGTNIFQRKKRKAEAFTPAAEILFMTATKTVKMRPPRDPAEEEEGVSSKLDSQSKSKQPRPRPKMFDQEVQVDMEPTEPHHKRKSKEQGKPRTVPKPGAKRNSIQKEPEQQQTSSLLVQQDPPPPKEKNKRKHSKDDDGLTRRRDSLKKKESPSKPIDKDEASPRRVSETVPKGRKFPSNDDSSKAKSDHDHRNSRDNTAHEDNTSDTRGNREEDFDDGSGKKKRRSSDDSKRRKRRSSDDKERRRRSSDGSGKPKRGSRRRSSDASKKRRSSGGTEGDESGKRRRSSQRKSEDEDNRRYGDWWPWF
ncbi:RNA polymerase-associated protein CTR9, partial [Orchesella cincta]